MTGTAVFNLPVLFLEAAHGTGTASFDLPVVTLTASGITGGASAGVFNLPVLTLAAAGLTGRAGAAAFSLPVLTLSAVGVQQGFGTAAFALPLLGLSAVGVTGGVGSAVLELPVLTLSAAGLHNVTGVATFDLPVLLLRAAGGPTLVEAYRTWVLNTRKGPLTEYDSFAFNSYALFNGLVLAAGPSGVVTLGTQALDGATAITARVRTGQHDYGETHLKRVPRIYLGVKADGDLLFRTIVTATGERTYRLPYNHVTDWQQRRIPVGKGPKSRYWQYELENESGADFSVQGILAYPTDLRRRVM